MENFETPGGITGRIFGGITEVIPVEILEQILEESQNEFPEESQNIQQNLRRDSDLFWYRNIHLKTWEERVDSLF